jgi:phosphoesterase RecJ-like protein
MVMDFQNPIKDASRQAVELIGKSNKVLITTHTRPDGDACGCIAAISQTLTALGKNVRTLLLSELPAWYQFLFERKPEVFSPSTSLGMVSPSNHKKTKIDSDLIVIVDTASYNQLPEFNKYLKQSERAVLVIDHHVSSDNLGDCRLIDSSAAATGLIVFDLLKYAGWPITKKMAEALFVAVSTDTGWFQFDNTDSRTLKVCAELIDAGAKPAKIHHDLYQNFSPQRLKLMVKMLDTLELHLDGRFAIQHLTQTDFKQTGAKLNDTENLIDECRRINSVELAALFVEQDDGKVKVSLRSTCACDTCAGTTGAGRGAINVCEIAEKFGGGGHKMAAGTHLPGPLENAKKLIFNAVSEQYLKINSK